MTRFVVDCSVTMAWCFEDEADRYTEAVLTALSTGTAVVPALWPLEVTNVLLVAERRRRLTRADTTRFLELLSALPIVIDGPATIREMDRLVSLGREHGLSSYDACYLDLSMRERIALATRDRALKEAARARGARLFA